jgi:D-sedoheptulose 7-phosphate isomerase
MSSLPISSSDSHATGDAFLSAYRDRLGDLIAQIDLGAVAAAVDCLYDAWARSALVALAGNGGSASTASHFANDLVKAARVEGRHLFRAVSLADNVSALTAHANDHGYDTVFAVQMDSLFQAGDVFIAISASGNSPNVLRAVERAKEIGGCTIGLVGFAGGALAREADIVLHTPTESGEYGPVEDVHLVLNHMITGCLLERMTADSATGS